MIKRFLAANWLQIDISFINFIFINERGQFSTTFPTPVLYFFLVASDKLLVTVIKKSCKISSSISFIDQTLRDWKNNRNRFNTQLKMDLKTGDPKIKICLLL
jgi:hypothetical protein